MASSEDNKISIKRLLLKKKSSLR